MTRTGKCDTCRLRKVKCDEQKPKCSACQKRDRPCAYSYGKVSALVVEDPNLLSKHGKPKVAPLVYPLISYSDSSSASSPSSDLRVTAERAADEGQGVFKTFTPASKERQLRVRKPTAQQRRKLHAYLTQLRAASTLQSRLSSSESVLITRYMGLLGSLPLNEKPLMILGSWILSIPSRIGANPVVDLAVEYLVDQFAVYRDDNFSNRRLALASKAKALEELQLATSDDKSWRTYDTVLAMKLHYSAEVLVGMRSLRHVIHGAALAEILKLGPVAGLDEEHYWGFLDNTYIDDVVEAMVSGRTSVYDNDFYLSMTYPPSPPTCTELDNLALRFSVAMMHILIQVPRLVCIVRHCINNPANARVLALAVTLSESLWHAVPVNLMHQLLRKSTTVVEIPPSPDISDIISDSFHFDSIESMTLVSRFWMLQHYLCGLIQSIYQHFPILATDSLLPDLATLYAIDIDAAINQARCVQYALNLCPSFPLVPLRVHVPLEVAIGAWHRLSQRLSRAPKALGSSSVSPAGLNGLEEILKAQRMEDWIVETISCIHDQWDVHPMTNQFLKKFMQESVEAMCGGPIPDWLPLRVSFTCEEGDMVMKLEYDLPGPMIEKMYGKPEESWTRSTTTSLPFPVSDSQDSVPTESFPSEIAKRPSHTTLPHRTTQLYPANSPENVTHIGHVSVRL